MCAYDNEIRGFRQSGKYVHRCSTHHLCLHSDPGFLARYPVGLCLRQFMLGVELLIRSRCHGGCRGDGASNGQCSSPTSFALGGSVGAPARASWCRTSYPPHTRRRWRLARTGVPNWTRSTRPSRPNTIQSQFAAKVAQPARVVCARRSLRSLWCDSQRRMIRDRAIVETVTAMTSAAP